MVVGGSQSTEDDEGDVVGGKEIEIVYRSLRVLCAAALEDLALTSSQTKLSA